MFAQDVPVLAKRPLLRPFLRLAACLLALASPLGADLAAGVEPPSGLKVPRFVTTRSNQINVRKGPGTKYDVAWVYVRAGTPVEIIQEYDTWRKVRDVDGTEGWLHQNLLQGKRAGLVAPWKAVDEQVALRRDRADDAGVRAWLGPKFRVEIKECDGAWCQVVATTHPKDAAAQSYEGYLHQEDLWGVYKDEVFD